ncbi:MAG: 30S ribosomal protein S9 [Actinobacteria bacterium]|nr:30S ribosomal protein S9 [Actinomycetota bacterium]
MTETVEETVADEVVPFVEDDREIAYRAEAQPSAPLPGGRPAVVAPAGATGRRKEAIARVRIKPGTGQFSINGRTLEDYFPNKLHQQTVNEPFVTAAVVGSYDVIATIVGGGVTGQAGALRLGIARALNAVDAEASRPALKKAGLKNARKAPQYSKR